jgi:methionyl-tRNA synthetase
MEIDFDKFGRTTTEEQTKIAQDIFLRLHENGLLVEDSILQLYCDKCDR